MTLRTERLTGENPEEILWARHLEIKVCAALCNLCGKAIFAGSCEFVPPLQQGGATLDAEDYQGNQAGPRQADAHR